MSSLVLLLAIFLWGAVHSVLASHAVKGWISRRFGAGFSRWYRLGYNLFAALTFLPLLALTVLLPDRLVYVFPWPWTGLALAGQAVALLFLAIGLLQTDIWEFLGLRAASSQPQLVQTGLYRYVRHPLYTAGLFFLWLAPRMSWNQLLLSLGLTLYILVGAWFEERKLLREFGSAYAEYRARTPMFFPCPVFKR